MPISEHSLMEYEVTNTFQLIVLQFKDELEQQQKLMYKKSNKFGIKYSILVLL